MARGPHYTHKQFQELENMQREEMSRLIRTMNETGSDQEELEELSQDLRVRFKTKAQASKPTKDDLWKTLAAKTRGHNKATPAVPTLWFGLCSKTTDRSHKTNRWITSDPIEANDAATRPGCIIPRVFHFREEAEDWIKDDDTPMPDLLPPQKKKGVSNEDSNSSEDENDVALDALVKKAATVAYLKKKKQARRHTKKEQEEKEEHGQMKQARKRQPPTPHSHHRSKQA
jgi:hypothetical protein